jgi:hypothetical protein
MLVPATRPQENLKPFDDQSFQEQMCSDWRISELGAASMLNISALGVGSGSWKTMCGNENLGIRIGKKRDTLGGIAFRRFWFLGEAHCGEASSADLMDFSFNINTI